jgi:hypothetical protein
MPALRVFGLCITLLSLLMRGPIGADAQRQETLSGTIIRIEDKHHLVVAQQRTAGTWRVPDTARYRVGERIAGTGSVDRNGVFFPAAIRIVSIPTTPLPSTPAPLVNCSGYRWPIKVAADPGATQVVPVARTTTIADLVALARPAASAIRNSPVETTIWQIANARLSFLYQEHDRDYHLVLDDGRGHHLIAEAPDPNCARTSTLLPEINRVRSEINARLGGVHGNMRPNLTVSVRGVGFFDQYSGSTGQARNAIEVHPITAICFGENCAL